MNSIFRNARFPNLLRQHVKKEGNQFGLKLNHRITVPPVILWNLILKTPWGSIASLKNML